MGKDLRREVEAQKSRRVAAETRVRQAESRIESMQEIIAEQQKAKGEGTVCNARAVSSES